MEGTLGRVWAVACLLLLTLSRAQETVTMDREVALTIGGGVAELGIVLSAPPGTENAVVVSLNLPSWLQATPSSSIQFTTNNTANLTLTIVPPGHVGRHSVQVNVTGNANYAAVSNASVTVYGAMTIPIVQDSIVQGASGIMTDTSLVRDGLSDNPLNLAYDCAGQIRIDAQDQLALVPLDEHVFVLSSSRLDLGVLLLSTVAPHSYVGSVSCSFSLVGIDADFFVWQPSDNFTVVVHALDSSESGFWTPTAIGLVSGGAALAIIVLIVIVGCCCGMCSGCCGRRGGRSDKTGGTADGTTQHTGPPTHHGTVDGRTPRASTSAASRNRGASKGKQGSLSTGSAIADGADGADGTGVVDEDGAVLGAGAPTSSRASLDLALAIVTDATIAAGAHHRNHQPSAGASAPPADTCCDLLWYYLCCCCVWERVFGCCRCCRSDDEDAELAAAGGGGGSGVPAIYTGSPGSASRQHPSNKSPSFLRRHLHTEKMKKAHNLASLELSQVSAIKAISVHALSPSFSASGSVARVRTISTPSAEVSEIQPTYHIFAPNSIAVAKTVSIHELHRQVFTGQSMTEWMALEAATSGNSKFLESVYQCTSAEKAKNRFINILPNRYTLVRLEDGTYVNANVIGTLNRVWPGSETTYISTQAPKPNTMEDFWGMIWQRGVVLVVMLTKLEEHGKHTADRYWPEDEKKSETQGSYKISLQSVQTVVAPVAPSSPGASSLSSAVSPSSPAAKMALSMLNNSNSSSDIVIRQLTVEHLPTGQTRTIKQLQFLGWPDHGVPTYYEPLTHLFHAYRSLRAESPHATVLVHCSAGMGRTGAFIGLDIAIDHLEYSSSPFAPPATSSATVTATGSGSLPHAHSHAHGSNISGSSLRSLLQAPHDRTSNALVSSLSVTIEEPSAPSIFSSSSSSSSSSAAAAASSLSTVNAPLVAPTSMVPSSSTSSLAFAPLVSGGRPPSRSVSQAPSSSPPSPSHHASATILPLSEISINLTDIVLYLRYNRPAMVQSEAQFALLFQYLDFMYQQHQYVEQLHPHHLPAPAFRFTNLKPYALPAPSTNRHNSSWGPTNNSSSPVDASARRALLEVSSHAHPGSAAVALNAGSAYAAYSPPEHKKDKESTSTLAMSMSEVLRNKEKEMYMLLPRVRQAVIEATMVDQLPALKSVLGGGSAAAATAPDSYVHMPIDLLQTCLAIACAQRHLRLVDYFVLIQGADVHFDTYYHTVALWNACKDNDTRRAVDRALAYFRKTVEDFFDSVCGEESEQKELREHREHSQHSQHPFSMASMPSPSSLVHHHASPSRRIADIVNCYLY